MSQLSSMDTRGPLRALRDSVRSLVEASAPETRSHGPRRGRSTAASQQDYTALKHKVRALSLLDRQPAFYAFVAVRTLAFLMAAWAWVWLFRDSALVWLAAPLLGFASGQVVLLAHDACHHAIFGNRHANHLLGLLAINLLNGGSYTWWTASHNEHHARSNSRGNDPDMDYPMLAFDAEQARTKHPMFTVLLAHQHQLAPLLMCGVGLSMRVYSVAHLWRHPGHRLERLAFVLHWLAYPAALWMLLGPLPGLLMLLAHQAFFGLYVGSVTSANHWGMPMPENAEQLGFAHHQVLTSRNVAGGALVDLWFGGLNRQIEHHLFPTMPRNRLVEVRPLVQELCAARGIPYVERPFLGTYRDVYACLQSVALGVARERGSMAPKA